MDDMTKQAELIELKALKDEMVRMATRAVASGGEPLPRVTRALVLAGTQLYVAHHGEVATAKFFRELADEIDRQATPAN